MKNRALYICAALLLFFLAIFSAAKQRVTAARAEFSYQLQVSAAPFPPVLLKALAGEFKGLVANYFFLEAASFIGGDMEAEEREWAAVARLIEQSSILDPYFKQTYSFAQGVLPWHAKKLDETLIILERSSKHRTWDWVPGFFIGFNHFYFKNDNATASKALMEASKVPGAPGALSTWAARLASQAGQYQTAIEFLVGMYESTDDEHQKEMLMRRIQAVRTAYVLQQAVDRFGEQFGHTPVSLDELVEKGLIEELPENPYHRPFALNDEGMVEF